MGIFSENFNPFSLLYRSLYWNKGKIGKGKWIKLPQKGP